ncbi:Ig-like domain-containing protein [Corallococcus exiguus]|uniref:RHS repeat-associated core domain-containing protein n=1 Tax=Corallococcus exiguus TaxID=83462 RepID=UPI001A906AD0|nr:RHS repeat-associated core domain-containing protein [Corallococcus exiguus]MBN8466758.1 Ig-like domain-containing protein [Corallococcus exiguus]
MSGRVRIQGLWGALLLAVVMACGKTPERPPEAPASKPSGAVASTRMRLTPAQLAPACVGVIEEAVGPAWRGGTLPVQGGQQGTSSFTGTLNEPALVVVQNGDARGANEVATSEVTLNGTVLGGVSAGTPLAVFRVALQEANQLSASTTGGGSVRVSVASLGALPCSLADSGYVQAGPEPVSRSLEFAPDAAAGRVAVLVVDMVGPDADGTVRFNGVDMLAGLTGAQKRTFVSKVTLAATNQLELTVLGGPESSVRAAVFDADTLPSTLTMREPEPGSFFTSSPVRVSGQFGADAKSVVINGMTAMLSGQSGYYLDLPLVEGTNAVTTVIADQCANVTRVCHPVALDSQAPVITVSGVTEGAITRGPVTLSYTVTGLGPLTEAATVDGVPIANGASYSAEGSHEWLVTATDPEGRVAKKRVRFRILTIGPVLEIVGVAADAHYPGPVVPTVTVHSEFLETTSFIRDSIFDWKSGEPIVGEGQHRLFLVAKDWAANFAVVDMYFTIDQTFPVVSIVGVEEGSFHDVPFEVTFSATDAHLIAGSVVGRLDGVEFPNGSTVAGEGQHTLEVEATDRAGNRTVAQRHFTLDLNPPVITLGGLPQTSPVSTTVTPTFTVEDVNLKSVTATLKGVPFESGTEVTEDGSYVLEVTAEDFSGRQSSVVASFSIDRTAPVIEVTGVTPDAHYKAPVQVGFTATDVYPQSLTAKLNGADFTSGTQVAEAGEYTLVVTAVDQLNHTSTSTVHFVLDFMPPVLQLTGLPAQPLTNQQVTPGWTLTEAHPDRVEAKLDGVVFEAGTTLSASKDYTLVVSAWDRAGNTDSKTAQFTIDRVAPVITVTGVADGQHRNTPATISWTVEDAHPGTVTAKLDGADFTSGTTVSAGGSHTLLITAVDQAGNSAEAQRTFIIDTAPPVPTIQSPQNGLVTREAQVEVAVSVTEPGQVSRIEVGGVELVKGTDNVWRHAVPLNEGTNVLTVSVLDAAGNASTASVTVVRDSTAPQLVVTSPSSNARIGALSVKVRGTAKDATPVVLTLNGTAVPLTADGAFEVTHALTQGANTLLLRLTDAADNLTEQTLQLRANATLPTLSLTAPVDGLVTEQTSVTVRGTASAADSTDTVTVVVAGALAATLPDHSFQRTVQLSPGTQTLTVVAMDSYGLRTESTVNVTRNVTLPDGGIADAGTGTGSDAGTTVDAGSPLDGGSGSDAGTSVDAGSGAAAPVLALESPTQGAVLGGVSVAVAGQVQGGTLPLQVKVNGVSAAVSARSFTLALALPEGDHTLAVQVTDAEGRSASTTRTVAVDRTKPTLTITDPATSPATVNESPYVVKGTVGDTHLAGVTVKGQPATVLGGAFSVPVALAQGQTVVEVVAVDQAGNTERKSLTLIVDHAPPLVTVLSPVSGSESPQAVVHVRAKVEAFAALSEVRIGTGLAAEESSGVYGADLPLSLGENTLKVQATDVNGLIGRASVVVRYRNPATEPLVVTGVQPSAGASDVKTDALISVSFNKAATLASVRQGFKVKAQGKNLEGGYSLAPGGQTATFIANAPLPEGELLQVEVKGIQAEVGPEQGSAFYSQLTVRRPLTRVRGSVMDDAFEPLSGVRVILEGTAETTRTSADGNWSFITSASGPRVVRYEGGMTAEGRPLPTVRRMLTITPEVETVDAPLALTAVDTASATRVDTTQALHVDFAQKHGALAIDGDPGSLLFEDGKTEGQLTATRLQPVSLPVRLENNATPTAVWQVGPAGVRVQKPILLQFPNVTGLPAGRYVLVLAHEPRTHVLARAGLAVVSQDGASIRTEEPLSLRSVELVGYMALTEQQDTIVREALARSGGQGSATPDAGMEGALPPGMLQTPEAPWWKRGLNLIVGTAYAQGLLGYAAAIPALDYIIQTSVPASVSGKVRAPQDQQLTVQLSQELETFISLPQQVTFPYALPVSLRASRISDGSGAERIEAFLSAKAEGGAAISPPAGETWSVSAQRDDDQELTLAGNVELVRGGTTVITLNARMGTELRTVTLTVRTVPVADAGVQTFRLLFARDDQASSSGKELQSVVRFPGVRVTVTGPGPTMSGVTGETGGYGIPVLVPGGEAMGIACADIPLGPRPLLGHDPETGAAVVQSMVSASYPTCSPTFTTFSGGQTRADILVDARLLHGALYFVDREGRSLRHDCGANATSEFDAQKEGFASIADVDIPRTEVHFFRADDLERPIAQFTVGVPGTQCDEAQSAQRIAQGRYARVRMGPTTPFKRVIRERCRELNPAIVQDPSAPTPTTLSDEDRAFYETECRDNRTNFLRLTAGEPLVVVAVNHATGHTGMTRIQVPAISKMQLDANGRCALDDQLGPLTVDDFGQPAKLSRCSVASLGIEAPVYLYPPEIDVRVWRSADPEGVKQDAPPTLVRTGGAATTRDTYVHLDTHWRVRTLAPAEWRLPDGGVSESPVDAGQPADRVDGGISECRVPNPDGGTVPCRPDLLRDEGVSGRLLETCSAYGPGAASQQTKAAACFREGDLEDVPAGVPPLAGRVVRVTGSAVEEPAVAQFGVVPGRGSAALQAAMRIVTASGQRVTLGSLPKANYYLHVVGHEVFPRDQDGDGILRPQERNAPPPDFSEAEGEHPAGLPKRALGLKNVYTSLDPDGFKVLRYDPALEHEFRVVELTNPEVVAQGSLDSRVLDGEKPEADADDLAYQFFAGLMQPGAGRATTPTGDYVVRFGSDDYGVECEVDVTSDSITGNCDNEFIEDVLSANDLLYVELYLSGNADNVLYRFNLMGISPRVDLLKAGSAYTAKHSVETGTGGRSVTDRAISMPASAHFALDPAVIHSGRVKICTSKDCGPQELVNQADVELLPDGTYDVHEVTGGLAEDPLEQKDQFGLNGARLFQQPIPAHLVLMPGTSVTEKPLYLVQEVLLPEARRLVRTLGKPRGTFEGLHARAPGQLTVQGINVADGHLSFEHEDFAVPQLAEVVRFARTYNNQSSLVSPTGVGWTNNYEGYVQEERLGRYTVVIAGQAFDFPTCATTDSDAGTASGCVRDGSHGMELTVEPGDSEQIVAHVQTAEGFVYEFETQAKGFPKKERRRWLLNRFHDGHGRGMEGWTQFTYKPDSNLVSTVERTPGRLQVAMTYDDIDTADETVAYRLRNMGRNQGFALLKTVEVRLKESEQVLHHLDFEHDKRGNLKSVTRTSALPATQVWEYDYAPLPSGLTGRKLWSASNEVTNARLKLSAPTSGGTPFSQWQAVYGREAEKGIYEHEEAAFEVVTSVTGTGMPAPGWRIVAPNEGTRTVKRPDGVDVTLDLNEYGNTRATEVPGLGPSTLAWGSEVRGGPVQVNASVSPMGRAVSNTVNDKLQLDGVTLTAAPGNSQPVPGASGGSLWSVTGRQTGRVTGTSVATGHGQVSVSRPLSASGDPAGVTVTDTNGELVFTAQQFPDPDGVVQGGQDPSGNTLTFWGHETQPLGLPRFAEVTRAVQTPGGRATYQVEYGYDALGNRVLEWNLTTGARVDLAYDAVGRLLTRTVAGSPGQAWSYSYVLGDDTLQVTETLNLARWGRSQSNTTMYQQGLKRAESFTYGVPGQTATILYDGYQGSRLESYLDARLHRHTLSYDTAGRLTGEKVDGQPLYANAVDADGHVIAVTNSNGLTTSIGYDALGRAVSWAYQSKDSGESCSADCQFADVETVVLDAAGAVVQRTFGSLAKKHVLDTTTLGRVSSVQSNAQSHGGIHSQTTYDLAGRVLTRVDHVTGLAETYTYDDALGRVTRYVRTVQSSDGERTLTESRAYSDNPSGNGSVLVTRVLSGESSTASTDRTEVRTYSVDALGRVLSITETVDGQPAIHTRQYDALGREFASTDPEGRRTETEYDTAGNLVSVSQIAPSRTVKTTFTHDAEGNVLTQLGPREDEEWGTSYDALGRMLSRTLKGPPQALWTYAYPGNGVERETDPEGTVIERTRNARGLVELEVWNGGESSQRSVRTRYDGSWVKRQESTEGTSVRVLRRDLANAIDDRGRTRNEEETWSSAGYSYSYKTSTDWADAERRSTSTESWRMNDKDQGSRTVTARVDSLGNVVRRIQGGAEDQWSYYADGNPMWSRAYGFGANEQTRWAYDTSGRVKTKHFGPTEQTTYSYFPDGQLHTETTPDTRVRTLWYNDRGLLELETFGRGADISRTYYGDHDNAGNAREVRQASGNSDDEAIWHYKYGPRDELLEVTPPGLGAFVYRYDSLARLESIKAPTGSVTPEVTYDYDFLGREKLRSRGASSWVTTWTNGNPEVSNELNERVERILDGRGRVVHEEFKGVLAEAGSGPRRVFKDLESVDYEFNGLDQLRKVTEHRGSNQTERSLTYDGQDRLWTIGTGISDRISYHYHSSGELLSVQSPSGTVNYDVGPLQRLSKVTLADGRQLDVKWETGGSRLEYVGDNTLKHSYCYDNRGRIASVTHDVRRENCDSTTGTGSPYLRYSYTYDNRGNRITEIVDRTPTEMPTATETTRYGYDKADRLMGVTYPDGQSVLYALHNDGSRRAEKKVTGYAGTLSESGFNAVSQPQEHLEYFYDALGGLEATKDKLASNAVVAEYQTDLAGRLVSEKRGNLTKLFHFDAAGRLVEVEQTDETPLRKVTYQYDYAGLRRSRTVGTATTSYLWSGESLVEEHLPNSTPLLYQQGAGLTVATGSERVLQDGLGSAVARVSTSGTTIESPYDAWGNYRNGNGPDSTQPSIGYTGHAWDAEAGLTYAQQRWLDPTTGRFFSEDPVEALGYLATPNELNPWLYAASNPLRYVDPDGRELKEGSAASPWVGKLFQQELEEFSDEQLRSFLLSEDDMWGQTDAIRGELKLVDAVNGLSREQLIVQACGTLKCTPGVGTSGTLAYWAELARRTTDSSWTSVKGFIASRPIVRKTKATLAAADESLRDTARALGAEATSGLNPYANSSNPVYMSANAESTRRANALGGDIGEMAYENARDEILAGVVVNGLRAGVGIGKHLRAGGGKKASVYVDNNIMSVIDAADEEALRFAERHKGSIAITPIVKTEFLAKRSEAQLSSIVERYGISIVPEPDASRVAAEMAKVGVSAPKKVNDISILTAAMRDGGTLVTGDQSLAYSAMRAEHPVKYRYFEGDRKDRLLVYGKVREKIVQQNKGQLKISRRSQGKISPKLIDPSSVTGGRK